MSRILMLNQVAGPLFRELAEDISIAFAGADLLSGHLYDLARKPDASLRLISGPDYDRASPWRRAVSWLAFFLRAMREALRSNRDTLLLIVSNPPFLGAVGLFMSLLRGQKYCILVYDIYPGVLVGLGLIKRKGIIARSWRFFNRLVLGRAEIVFTIGEYMAANLLENCGDLADIRVIPVWCDVDFIRPMPRESNSFVQSLGWEDRTIVLYSGNLGATHNLDNLIEVARRLHIRDDIGFLIIGSGSKWSDLRSSIDTYRLENVKLLPFQPEALLPLTLSSGDISIVSMEPAVSGFMVPSKSFYYLAAGSAILAIMPPNNEVSDLVQQYSCGLRVTPGNTDALLESILSMVDDKRLLAKFKSNARNTAETKFSRRNTSSFIASLSPLIQGSSR